MVVYRESNFDVAIEQKTHILQIQWQLLMNHWTTYWQSTTSLNSFAEGAAASGYEGEIKSFWDSIYAQTDKNASILDLGTGNGGLAVLALQFSQANDCQFKVHGNDAAAINPAQQLKDDAELAALLAQITFFPSTTNEQLPLDDASIGLVTSQFAFEYGDMAASVSELSRVLEPGGRAILMLHHSDSFLVQDSRAGVNVLSDVLKQSPLFVQAELAFHLLNLPPSTANANPTALYQASAQSLQWIMQQLQQRYQDEANQPWVNDALSRVAQHMTKAGQLPPAQLLQSLHRHYSQLSGHLVRIEEQVQSAYDDSRAEALIAAAKQHGLQARYAPFSLTEDADTPFAMVAELVKPA